MFKNLFSMLVILSITFSSIAYSKPMDKMNLEEKIGQMMCLDFRYWRDEKNNLKPVTQINEDIKEIIKKYHIGSVILFSQNFENESQAKKLISDLQSVALESQGVPLLVCVDQEGGIVERFSFNRKKLKNNLEIGKSVNAEKLAFEKGQIIGQELFNLGINCNLAPVVDINTNPKNPVINVRSFGNTPEIVSKCSLQFMRGMRSKNVFASAKHFPGHGDTSVDSHVGLPRVNKNLTQLENVELKPFKDMINSGVQLITTAHIQLPNIESSTVISKKDGRKIFLPATLSKKILTDLLRKNLGFQGIIITDAMEMRAISENFGESEAVSKAINAGANIICMPTTLRSKNDTKKLDIIFNDLKRKNLLLISQINDSVSRILNLKDKIKS